MGFYSYYILFFVSTQMHIFGSSLCITRINFAIVKDKRKNKAGIVSFLYEICTFCSFDIRSPDFVLFLKYF